MCANILEISQRKMQNDRASETTRYKCASPQIFSATKEAILQCDASCREGAGSDTYPRWTSCRVWKRSLDGNGIAICSNWKGDLCYHLWIGEISYIHIREETLDRVRSPTPRSIIEKTAVQSPVVSWTLMRTQLYCIDPTYQNGATVYLADLLTRAYLLNNGTSTQEMAI